MMFELTLFASLALYHLIIGGGLLIILGLVFWWLPAGPDLRSWLWATAFVVATLVPFMAFVPVPVSAPVSTLGAPLPVSPAVPVISETEAISPISRTAAHDANKAEWHVPSAVIFYLKPVFYLFLILWAVGSARRLWQLGGSLWRARHLRESAIPLSASKAGGEALARLSPVPLLQSTAVTSPMAVGLWMPAIIIPASLRERFTDDQLAPIVLHEVAHIERKDLWVGLFQECLAIVFWWSPVMRLLNHKIHITRELACDRSAASVLSSGKHYAQALLDCAQLMVSERRNALAMGLFTHKKELNDRINAVLNLKQSKASSFRTTAFACLALALASSGAAHAYMPSISLSSVQGEANFFSKLSRAEGEVLMEAIRQSNRGKIGAMMANGLDINTPIIGDGTALIVAVKYGDAQMVSWLLDQGADVNQAARGDGNPLIAAAMRGDQALVELLLSKGADIDAVVPGDETALIRASWQGHLDVVTYLVNQGADVNLGVKTRLFDIGENRTRTPLNMAATDAIRDYLISAGAKK